MVGVEGAFPFQVIAETLPGQPIEPAVFDAAPVPPAPLPVAWPTVHVATFAAVAWVDWPETPPTVAYHAAPPAPPPAAARLVPSQ